MKTVRQQHPNISTVHLLNFSIITVEQTQIVLATNRSVCGQHIWIVAEMLDLGNTAFR